MFYCALTCKIAEYKIQCSSSSSVNNCGVFFPQCKVIESVVTVRRYEEHAKETPMETIIISDCEIIRIRSLYSDIGKSSLFNAHTSFSQFHLVILFQGKKKSLEEVQVFSSSLFFYLDGNNNLKPVKNIWQQMSVTHSASEMEYLGSM